MTAALHPKFVDAYFARRGVIPAHPEDKSPLRRWWLAMQLREARDMRSAMERSLAFGRDFTGNALSAEDREWLTDAIVAQRGREADISAEIERWRAKR
jgi:hypothetical protein